MGNRAVITTEDKTLGIYVHWNGGYDSIEAFLTFCKIKGYRAPEYDSYGWARLTQAIANFFGGDLCVGIDIYDRLDTDNGDNGVYIIKNWKIVGRECFSGLEQKGEYNIKEFVECINEKYIKEDRIPQEKIDAYFERKEVN